MTEPASDTRSEEEAIMKGTGSRRDRVRAATVQEITETARRILVEQGPEAITLRAIAREMGMTAPALYRYFGSHEELLRHIIGDLFDSLTTAVKTKLHEVPDGDMAQKFVTASAEFRRWALTHKPEYMLIFGAPLPGVDAVEEDVAQESGRKFGRIFLGLFVKLWDDSPFPIPADDEIDPGLRDQLLRYRERLDAEYLPLGVMLVFLECWTRLQGFVSLEVFGHLCFALSDPSPMFDLMLAEMAPRLGLTYP